MISNGNFLVLSPVLRSMWQTATLNEQLLISKSNKREGCFLFAANSDEGNRGLKTTSQISSNGKLQYKNQIKPSVSRECFRYSAIIVLLEQINRGEQNDN